ncbi:MAG: hypothetical protein HZA89_00315 [Verrucomicrobia bacterium]|nr:hypothetical protein [Verrucomicrobiota bacterium]
MASKEYIERLQMVIHQLHGCGSQHVETVPVHEVFRGQTVWQGKVEVFDLTGHPKAKRCYAWSHREGKNDEGERFVAVLEIPPVKSALTAVQASIISDAKKRR